MDIKSLFIGEIYFTIPHAGVAIVKPTDPQGDFVLGHLPQQDSKFGAFPLSSLAPGQNVVCYRGYNNTQSLCHILCPINKAQTPVVNSYQWRKLNNLSRASTADPWFKYNWDAFRVLMENTADDWVHNHAHGTDGDVLPGDFDIMERYSGGVGLHVGYFLSQLRGSPLAYVEASSLNHQVRIIGDRIRQDTPISESFITHNYAVKNIAISLTEAFGRGDDKPVAKVDDENENVDIDDPTLIPLYRMQQTEGSLIGGRESIVLEFPRDSVVHNADNEPAVLSRQRQSLSGEITSASALGIMSVKSPFISAIHQLGYDHSPINPYRDTLEFDELDKAAEKAEDSSKDDDEGEEPKFDDLREPFNLKPEDVTTTNAVPPNEEDAVDDAVINRVLDKLLSGDYTQKFRQMLSTEGFSTARLKKSVLSHFDIDEADDTTWRYGDSDVCVPTSEQQFKLPKKIKIKDPSTGVEHSYYDTLSFVSQEPDGSITICDGYGSEIRMSRGNIYISAALDVFIRPGRDLSVMAGRHQAYNAQQTCTIHGSKVHARAEEDLKLSGGCASGGEVLLENRADGGNVDIKSAGSASMTASQNITLCRHKYVGDSSDSARSSNIASRSGGNEQTPAIRGRTSVDDTGLDENAEGSSKPVLTDPDTSGSIIIDAGLKGTCFVHGSGCTIDSQTTALIGSTQTDDGKRDRSANTDSIGGADGAEGVAQEGEQGTSKDKGSALLVNPNNIYWVTKNAVASSNLVLRAQADEDTPVVNSIRGGRAVRLKLEARVKKAGNKDIKELESADLMFQVDGHASVGGHLVVEKQGLIKNQDKMSDYALITNGIATSRDPQSRIEQHPTDVSKWPFKPLEIPPIDVNTGLGLAVARQTAACSNYKDAYLDSIEFTYPEYNVQWTKIPGMMWQEKFRDNKSGGHWVEAYLHSLVTDGVTACYPGYSVWENVQVTTREYKRVAAKTGGYIING